MNKIGAFLLGQNWGDPKKSLSSWGGRKFFFSKFEKPKKTSEGINVENMCTKFGGPAMIGSWSKIGGTKRREKKKKKKIKMMMMRKN